MDSIFRQIQAKLLNSNRVSFWANNGDSSYLSFPSVTGKRQQRVAHRTAIKCERWSPQQKLSKFEWYYEGLVNTS